MLARPRRIDAAIGGDGDVSVAYYSACRIMACNSGAYNMKGDTSQHMLKHDGHREWAIVSSRRRSWRFYDAIIAFRRIVSASAPRGKPLRVMSVKMPRPSGGVSTSMLSKATTLAMRIGTAPAPSHYRSSHALSDVAAARHSADMTTRHAFISGPRRLTGPAARYQGR